MAVVSYSEAVVIWSLLVAALVAGYLLLLDDCCGHLLWSFVDMVIGSSVIG